MSELTPGVVRGELAREAARMDEWHLTQEPVRGELKVGKAKVTQLDEEKVREIIKEELHNLRQNIVLDTVKILSEHDFGQP